MSLADLYVMRDVPNIAAKLGPSGMRLLLQLMWDAYADLVKDKVIDHKMNEPQITNLWFLRILRLWKEKDLPVYPIPEHPDSTKAKKRGKLPSVDFCFTSYWDEKSYFGAECKLLEKSYHYKHYIRGGVNRHLLGIYNSKSSSGAMIGYIRLGNSKTAVEEIRKLFKELSGNPPLMREENWTQEHYTSTHNRPEGISPFILHHLFFVFSC